MVEGEGGRDSLETEFTCCWLWRYRPSQNRGGSCPAFTSLTPSHFFLVSSFCIFISFSYFHFFFISSSVFSFLFLIFISFSFLFLIFISFYFLSFYKAKRK